MAAMTGTHRPEQALLDALTRDLKTATQERDAALGRARELEARLGMGPDYVEPKTWDVTGTARVVLRARVLPGQHEHDAMLVEMRRKVPTLTCDDVEFTVTHVNGRELPADESKGGRGVSDEGQSLTTHRFGRKFEVTCSDGIALVGLYERRVAELEARVAYLETLTAQIDEWCDRTGTEMDLIELEGGT